MLEPTLRRYQSGKQRGEVIELHVGRELFKALFQEFQSKTYGCEGLGKHFLYGVPFLDGKVLTYAARHGPCLVDAFVRQNADYLLADSAQPDPFAGQVGEFLDQAHHVPRRRVMIEPQQQVGRTEVKEAQGVALDELRPIEDPAELFRGGRDSDTHDGVTGLHRGERMAGGTDAADPVGYAGHLVKGPSDAELFKGTEFDHMHACLGNLAPIVQIDRNLRMSLDPGDRFDM